MEHKRTRNKSKIDIGQVVYGKVPPQAKDIEEAILGAIMIDKSAIDIVCEYLHPEAFYVEAHQTIFQAMLSIHRRSQPIDILTVNEELNSNNKLEGVGGSYYVTKLTNSVVSSANIERHSQIIFEKFVQREQIRVGMEMIKSAFEDGGDVFESLEESERSLFAITNTLHKKSYSTTDSLLVKAIKEIDIMRNNQKELSGVTSGFPSMDKLTHGWQNTDLIILAARPAVGKTAFALNLAVNAAKAGTPVGFFSLEMSAGQLIRRAMSSESGIPLEKIQRGRLEEAGMKHLYQFAVAPLAKAKLFIDDQGGINIFEARAKARRLKQKENIGLIIIDYLQLMSGAAKNNNKGNREQEISEISRGLKQLAKELDIPVIALSQLSRETEKRSTKVPQLSDLRESGAIEQDADAVVFIYRPDYYGIRKDAMGEVTTGETEFNFAKYRNGSPGSVKLRAKLWMQRFTEMDEVDKTFGEKNKDGMTTVWMPFKDQVDADDDTFK